MVEAREEAARAQAEKAAKNERDRMVKPATKEERARRTTIFGTRATTTK